jgi:hypothetical protein
MGASISLLMLAGCHRRRSLSTLLACVWSELLAMWKLLGMLLLHAVLDLLGTDLLIVTLTRFRRGGKEKFGTMQPGEFYGKSHAAKGANIEHRAYPYLFFCIVIHHPRVMAHPKKAFHQSTLFLTQQFPYDRQINPCL